MKALGTETKQVLDIFDVDEGDILLVKTGAKVPVDGTVLTGEGYINEAILMEALRAMIAINEPHFKRVMNDLTDHQVSLVRATIDGVTRFSASDVIEKYALNSSANVRRVKDALKKKEVLTFNEKDEPVILDPLMEYWLNKYYFEIQ